MKHLQRWTVCLNNTSKDDQILKYVSEMARYYSPESIQLLHVIEGEIIYPEVRKKYTDLEDQQMLYYTNLLNEKSGKYLDGIKNVTVEVRKGSAQRTILEYTFENKTDLIFLGRAKGGNFNMKKVARSGNASLMIIPEHDFHRLNHILISTDFSPHSKRSLQIGTSLADSIQIPKVSMIHVYDDASKFLRETVETSFDVDQLLLKRRAVNKKLSGYIQVRMTEFVNSAVANTSVKNVLIPASSGTKKSEALVQWVKDSDVDFIVLGAKGQSSVSSFFLGSFAEDVYKRLTSQVILLYKEKEENAGILKQLFSNKN